MTIRYYTEEITKVPFRLLVHAVSASMPRPVAWCVAVVLFVSGRLGLRLPPSHGVGFWNTEKTIDPSDLPAPAIARWAPILEQLKDLGFEALSCEVTPTVGNKLQYSTLLLDKYGITTALLEWTRMPVLEGMEENTPLELNSYCNNGPDVVTGVVRERDVAMSEVFTLDSVDLLSLPESRPLAEAYQVHRDRCEGKQLLPLNETSALEVFRERAQRRFEELLQSGLLRELTPKEIERLRQVDVTELHNFS